MSRLTDVEKKAIKEDVLAGRNPVEIRKVYQLTSRQLNYYTKKFKAEAGEEPSKQAKIPTEPKGQPTEQPPEVDNLAVDKSIEREPSPQEQEANQEQKSSEEYGCPLCQGTFPQPYKICPHCGVQLQW